MRTLHLAYCIASIDRSLAFYVALGYGELGRVDIGDDAVLIFLKLPDDPIVTIELVHRPAAGAVDIGNGFHHLVVQVDDLARTIARLNHAGLAPEAIGHPGGPDGPATSWLTDPDGYRIELVEWPPGHADGMTEADVA